MHAIHENQFAYVVWGALMVIGHSHLTIFNGTIRRELTDEAVTRVTTYMDAMVCPEFVIVVGEPETRHFEYELYRMLFCI